MSNLGIDILLGDEMQAAETVRNALSGRPVSASAVADAAITIGSDLLMFVPGLGAAGAAVKAGKMARAASKGGKAITRANKAASEARTMKWNRVAGAKGVGRKATQRDQQIEKNLRHVASKEKQKAGKYARAAGIGEKTPTPARFEKARRDAMKAKAAAKRTRNSPKRRKLRYTGRIVSDTANIKQIAAAYDEDR